MLGIRGYITIYDASDMAISCDTRRILIGSAQSFAHDYLMSLISSAQSFANDYLTSVATDTCQIV